jgi:RNA polymerase sigma factor (sigma-70 family)
MPELRFLSDEELIAGIVNDSETALSSLYKGYYPSILHFIKLNNGSEDDAKDVFQEALIIFYEKVKDGSLELNCAIKTFIYSVSRRIWLKKLGEKKRFSDKMIDSEDFIAEESNELADENEKKFSLMSESMSQLGEPCKTLIEDFYVRRMSMTEITEKFGYTNADNAKTQKYKCLMRLKKIFFNAYEIKEPLL